NFLRLVGNPQDTLKSIHSAGTKGKGSTCAFISYILREAGYRTGLYTSPHLLSFRERIRILQPYRQGEERTAEGDFEGAIPEEDLIRLVDYLRPKIEKYNSNSQSGPLSFFEAYTTLAFVYFKEQRVDFAVLETGLGGRLDATNTVDSLVCAITPISYEHTQKLGNTLREIASEKAGIIKDNQGQFVIAAPQEEEARLVIRGRCQEVGAKLYEVGRDIRYQGTEAGFSLEGISSLYQDLKIKLTGQHQLANAALAVGVIEALGFHGIKINRQEIKRGLYKTIWPGRCEIISRNPLVVLDGAQNISSSIALREAIRTRFQYKRLFLVLGISNDKDIKGISKELHSLADGVILTRADNPRATPPQDLAEYFSGKPVYLTANIKEARTKACALAKGDDLVLVCGSLFVVGEFRDEATRSR
ncbi:MAG: folylpolyglutamate synthase/dihydrofolate synthase family protein, partial [bacterium]